MLHSHLHPRQRRISSSSAPTTTNDASRAPSLSMMPSPPLCTSSHRLFALATLLLALAATSMAGNCSTATPRTIIGDTMAVEVTGGVAIIYPVVNGKPDKEPFSLSTTLIMTVERLRDLTSSSRNRECRYAKNGNPLATEGGGEILGEILGYINITDFDCHVEHFTANYGPGRDVDTIQVTFSHPNSTLHHVAYFEVSNADFVKKTYTNTTFTHGQVYQVKYSNNLLKLSYDLANYPFEVQAPNKSFISLHHEHRFTLGAGIVNHYDYTSHAGFNWTSSDERYTLFLDLETAFVLDGLAYSSLDDVNDTFPSYPLYARTTLPPIQTGMRMCEDNDRWSFAHYDPTVGILFNVPPTPPNAPPSAGGLTRGQVIGLTLGVVFGALAVVGLIALLAIKVPAVRKFFRPFSARKPVTSSNLDSGKPSSAWKTSVTPASP